MKIKKILCGFLGLISVGIISGCGSESSSSSTSSVSNNDSQDDEINIIKNDKLAVDQNKCVGCGKCGRMAPDNFEMDAQTYKAQVKSNEIIDQVAINRAISVCHVRAINQ